MPRIREVKIRNAAVAVVLLALLVTLVFAASSDAQGENAGSGFSNPALVQPEPFLPGPQHPLRVEEPEVTDPSAAEELPLKDLDRAEAVELTESVFEPILQAVAGPSQDLQVDRYLSENAAIISGGIEQGTATAVGGGESGPTENPEGEKVLLESTMPLETENDRGETVPVDESLEPASDGAGLKPAASPVEVELPGQLGEGIELPSSGVGISLVGSPGDVAPTVVAETAAMYPNVATDTDFTVAPNPTGFQTFETLRTSESPTIETLHLDLPDGTELAGDEDGGAEIRRGGHTIFAIPSPTALDAAGHDVPATLSVAGDDLTVSVDTGQGVIYPVLVDPIFEREEGWNWFETPSYVLQNRWGYWASEPAFTGFNTPEGLWVKANRELYIQSGAQARYAYSVPRLSADEKEGQVPTSFIANALLYRMGFWPGRPGPNPFLFMGIWGSNGWVGKDPEHLAYWGWSGAGFEPEHGTGNVGGAVYLENGEPGNRDQSAKYVLWGLYSGGLTRLNLPRQAQLGAANVTIGDSDTPTVANPSISTE